MLLISKVKFLVLLLSFESVSDKLVERLELILIGVSSLCTILMDLLRVDILCRGHTKSIKSYFLKSKSEIIIVNKIT